MSYLVLWSRSAMTQMDKLLAAEAQPNQQRLVGFLEELIERLKNLPFDEGESRGANHRITCHESLVVQFRIDELEQTVYLTSVKRSGR
jgi:mRNA-degrading endonuclease RelE of RelBE toxin-antitoxin system